MLEGSEEVGHKVCGQIVVNDGSSEMIHVLLCSSLIKYRSNRKLF